MKTWIKKHGPLFLFPAALCALAFAALTALGEVAWAQGEAAVDAAPELSTTGLGTSPEIKVDVKNDGSANLPDPAADPGGAYAAIKDGWSRGWPIGVLVGVIMIAAFLKKRTKPGTRAAAIAGAVIVGAASVLALLTGEATWQQTSSALAIAIGVVLNPFAVVKEQAAS
jgi:hypothetical protein